MKRRESGRALFMEINSSHKAVSVSQYSVEKQGSALCASCIKRFEYARSGSNFSDIFSESQAKKL